jgi:hypothetical protein
MYCIRFGKYVVNSSLKSPQFQCRRALITHHFCPSKQISNHLLQSRRHYANSNILEEYSFIETTPPAPTPVQPERIAFDFAKFNPEQKRAIERYSILNSF